MLVDVDGRAVYAATGGKPFDAARPVVVFIHGVAMDHSVWSLQTRWFAHHGFAVLALDLPGTGRSAGPSPENIGRHADWLMRLLDAVGAKTAALAGHSMGGLIALEAAGRYPGRVRALALIGTMAPMPVNPEFMALARANDHKAVELMNDWSSGRRAHIGGSRTPGLWQIGDCTRLIERAAPGVMAAGLAACNDYADGAARAAAVRCPTLVVLGQRDQMSPLAKARAFGESIAGARVVVLPDTGHMLPVERPDEVLDALRTVL